jgi:hypothetical protein
MARLKGLKVVRSKVQGYGVVSTRRWKKGQVIADVDGVLWREGEQRDDRHSLILEPGVFFDMVDQTRWLNHSCDPNVVVEAGVTRRGNGWAQLQALRDIAPGEELCFDYALPHELKEPCACGTATCRGWIVEQPEPPAPTPPPPASARPAARPARRPTARQRRPSSPS